MKIDWTGLLGVVWMLGCFVSGTLGTGIIGTTKAIADTMDTQHSYHDEVARQ